MVFDLEKIRRVLSGRASTEAESAEHSAGPGVGQESPTEQRDRESEGILDDYDPSELCSRKDFLLELGIPHDAFFCQLIEEGGGTLPQKEFVEYSNLSSSTISRLLQEMEDDGQIGRVQMGRENIVYLPDHAPVEHIAVTDDGDDTLLD